VQLPPSARLLLLGVLGLTGCVQLGPDFHSPALPWLDHWNSPALEQVSQHQPQPDLKRWWTVFADPALERLIAEADAHNSSLKIAGLRVIEARAQLGVAQSGRYPQLQQARADSIYLDRNQSGGTRPIDSSAWNHSAGIDVGWELDFWGRFSRAIESADDSYFAAEANYQDVLILLRAQIAETYFALRTAEARRRIARDNAEQQKRSYEITEKLFNSGQNAELDLQQAKTQYLGTLSTVPEFDNQVQRTRNALATLIGRPPGPLPELAEQTGLIPLIDKAILQDIPANLLLRRPDIRAAELNAAAQSARIGVAETDLYPALTLFGSIGWSASTLNGSSNNLDLGGGPSLTWNIFDQGRLTNNIRVQDARLQQLIEVYRDAVRQAAREADDAASGLDSALQREQILRQSALSAQRSMTLASAQYREGYSDFQRVLDAQRALLQQQDSYLVSRSTAVSNLIALYKALGGGWYSDQPLIDQATREQMQQRTDWGDLLGPELNASDKHQSTTPPPQGESAAAPAQVKHYD
jgi:NodT family efflux transporter outer membrane factor (OMF) lipoprotein